MHLSYVCRPKSMFYKNALEITRALSSSASTGSKDSDSKPRQAPRALDLDGISLERSVKTGAESKPRGYIPNKKDLGQESSHIDQLLYARLQRRLFAPHSDSKPPRPPRRDNPPGDREQYTPRNVQATGLRSPRPRTGFTAPNAGGNKTGGVARVPRRTPRSGGAMARGSMSRTKDEEPEVPATPAVIPERIYDLTSHSRLTAPIRATARGDQSSDIAQRVRETVGGDYSGWLSKEDLAAAGKDEGVAPTARARLALAFNPTISPKDRKRLLSTTQMLLDKGKPAVAAPRA